MAQDELRCTSCGRSLGGRGTTHFRCPDCGANEIGRCDRCRDQSVHYTCERCGFEGP